MKEHPFLALAKIALLVVIGVLLALTFAAHNDTQKKVIETARRVDDVRDQVAEVRRQLQSEASAMERFDDLRDRIAAVQKGIERGVVVGPPRAPGTDAIVENPPTPATPSAPRKPGYLPLLSPEEDRVRPPDDEIDWNAELRVSSLSEPKGFNIYTSNRDRFVAVDVGYYVYYPLALRKESNKDQFRPGIAEQVEVSPDKCEFIVYLRKGVKWHRPPVDLTDPKYEWMRGDHEVTAEDLAFALEMILDERADSAQVRPSFREVKDYEVLDRHTFRVRWKVPDFYSQGSLLGDLAPFPKWIYTREEDGTPIDPASVGQRFGDHWFNKKLCGYGPYSLKEYKVNDYVLLERSESFWGRRPAFKTIRYKLALRADEPRYNLFMSFDAQGNRDQDAYPISATRLKRDILQNDGSSDLRKQLAAKKLFFFQYVRGMYAYAGWAGRSKLFSDPRVRRAMTMCTNTEVWRKEILKEEAVFGSGVAFLKSPEYDPTIARPPFDPDGAKSLLAEAGWTDSDDNGVLDKVIDGEKVEFRFKQLQSPGSSPELDAMTQDWQQSLKRIGVIMEPDYAEWNLFTKRVEDREFQSFSMAWYHGDDWKPDNLFHSRLIREPGSYNYVEWSNPRADEIMDQLLIEFDLEKRYALCHEFHRLFNDEQPYTILWTWNNTVAWDSRVGGYENPRPFTPAIDFRELWKVKDPPAKYGDGRYEIPKR